MERTTGRGVLRVPVRVDDIGRSLRADLPTARRPDGTRTAVAFTSVEAWDRAMTPGQQPVTLAEPVLRALLADVAIDALQVDPERLDVFTAGGADPPAHRARPGRSRPQVWRTLCRTTCV
ncbi:SAV_915 family protein [Nocardioides sp. NPDC092400]|uniref:SAV_915 family protein n=1 Tax=Nocardioides sp. NPDC092400 TaxID=3155196 RepID=UPI00343439D8